MAAADQDLSPRVEIDDDRALAYRVGYAWRELRRGASMGALRDHLCGVGDDALEPGQVDTLDVLVQAEAWRMGDLADALRVDPSTATRAVERLVRSGLAERTAASGDKRVVMVSVTPAGRERLHTIAGVRDQMLDRILSRYTADERLVLADYLERFVGALDDFVRDLEDGAPR